MPYIEERCVAGNTVEICRYYSIRYKSGEAGRAEKNKETSEAQKKINQRKAGRDLRRILNANFHDGDLLIRLDFFKTKPKDSKEMQKHISNALRKIRRKVKDFKYVYVKEVGPKGSRHIHMVCSKIDTELLRESWEHGGIHIDPLISNGQYRQIAEYFIKYADRTEKTETLVGKRWYGSKNLVKPKITKKVIKSNKFQKYIRTPKGYYLEKDSVRMGVNESGFEYMSYTLMKTERQERGR